MTTIYESEHDPLWRQAAADTVRVLRDNLLVLGSVSEEDFVHMAELIAYGVSYSRTAEDRTPQEDAVEFMTSIVEQTDYTESAEVLTLRALFSLSMYAVELFGDYESAASSPLYPSA